MKARVDDLDRAIVDLLKENGRMPCADMARRVGNVSANTISNRIRRMVQKGIMKVTSVADPCALGYPLTALIDVQTDQANPTELAQAVAKLDAVSYVAMVAGDRDLLVVVHVRDAEHLHRLVTSTLRRLPGITRTETRLLLTRSFKDLHDWSIPTDERRGEG